MIDLHVLGWKTCPYYVQALEVAETVPDANVIARGEDTMEEFAQFLQSDGWRHLAESMGSERARAHRSSPLVYAVEDGNTTFIGGMDDLVVYGGRRIAAADTVTPMKPGELAARDDVVMDWEQLATPYWTANVDDIQDELDIAAEKQEYDRQDYNQVTSAALLGMIGGPMGAASGLAGHDLYQALRGRETRGQRRRSRTAKAKQRAPATKATRYTVGTEKRGFGAMYVVRKVGGRKKWVRKPARSKRRKTGGRR